MNTGSHEARLAAEQRARVLIDRQLVESGWAVQDKKDLNLFAGHGVAVREVVMKTGHGRTDYLLYVDQKAVGSSRPSPRERRSPGGGGVAVGGVRRGAASRRKAQGSDRR